MACVDAPRLLLLLLPEPRPPCGFCQPTSAQVEQILPPRASLFDPFHRFAALPFLPPMFFKSLRLLRNRSCHHFYDSNATAHNEELQFSLIFYFRACHESFAFVCRFPSCSRERSW